MFGDALDADVAGGFGRSQLQCRPRWQRIGLGRHRADGSVGHLMAWDWLSPGATDRPVLRGRSNLGCAAFTHSDQSRCRDYALCGMTAHVAASDRGGAW